MPWPVKKACSDPRRLVSVDAGSTFHIKWRRSLVPCQNSPNLLAKLRSLNELPEMHDFQGFNA